MFENNNNIEKENYIKLLLDDKNKYEKVTILEAWRIYLDGKLTVIEKEEWDKYIKEFKEDLF
jgi:hypothetical protein